MDMNDIPDDMHLAEVATFDFGKEARKEAVNYMNAVNRVSAPYPNVNNAAAQGIGTSQPSAEVPASLDRPVSAAPNNAVGREASPILDAGKATGPVPTATKDAEIARYPDKDLTRQKKIAAEWMLSVAQNEWERVTLEELILDYRARLERWEPLTREQVKGELTHIARLAWDAALEEAGKQCDVIAKASQNSPDWMHFDDVTGGELAKRIRSLKLGAKP